MADNNNGVAWRITAVHDEARFIPGSGTDRLKRVHFELDDGTTSHVVIPEKDFTTETVQKQVHRAALDLASVVAMSGTIPFSDIAARYSEGHTEY